MARWYDAEIGALRAPPPGGGGWRPGSPQDPRMQQQQGNPQGRPPPGYQGPQQGPGSQLARPPFMPQQSPGFAVLDEDDVRQLIAEELKNRGIQGSAYTQVPGGAVDPALMSPMGLGFGTLTNTVSTLVLTAQPQRPFRGERLVVTILRSSGAALVDVRISDFKIGENSQLVASNAMPADMFASQAEGVRLAMTPAQPGVNIVLRFECTAGAVPAGETIALSAGIVGPSLWS